jgi:hypothetical protein
MSENFTHCSMFFYCEDILIIAGAVTSKEETHREDDGKTQFDMFV